MGSGAGTERTTGEAGTEGRYRVAESGLGAGNSTISLNNVGKGASIDGLTAGTCGRENIGGEITGRDGWG